MRRRLSCKSLQEGMEANNAGSQPNSRNTFSLSMHLTEESKINSMVDMN